MQPPMKSGMADDFQTPPEALIPLLPFIKKEWVIWECASGKGKLAKYLESKGFNVIATDILTGQDFLEGRIEKADCIITNPPYSLKEKFLERCYKLGKPFALLLPLTTFEGKIRQQLMSRYGIEVLFLPKRINFETPSGEGSGSWFATAWFTWGMNLPKQLNFVNNGTLLNIKR